MSYFDNFDSDIKAYLLGTIIFNIKKLNNNELIVQIGNINGFSHTITNELKKFTSEIERDSFVINSSDVIQSINKHIIDINNIDLEFFIKNNKREYSIELFKAFYEKYGNINENYCNITAYNKKYLEIFANFFNIPHKFSKVFNLEQLIYSNVNIIDLLGIIYKNKDFFIKNILYIQFMNLLNNERPTLKYIKTLPDAIIPTKANYSDVGYDLSIIGIAKEFNSKTKLYNTGIKLDIPLGYYVEIVPRSSISKSGYMLANSIGIIDCSYKGELFVALTKICDESPEISFPLKCCQLIMKKQIFPDMVETDELEVSKRSEGGFGSSG